MKDAEKLAQALQSMAADPENKYKSMTGWFVCREEPTAHQRTAVQGVAKKSGRTIHAISITQLYRRICDSEMYLQARDRAPFGSTAFSPQTFKQEIRVPVRLRSAGGNTFNVRDIATLAQQGKRILIAGDYGAGKSHALRDLYLELRKAHFKGGKLKAFPLHINLRDCAGLRTPSEILRRHAEEIGFSHADGLISAWRAGLCSILLDGFDEVLPSRWLGSAADLKNVRWEALAPIRRLLDETPATAGVVVAGRSHYFSSQAEMTHALGFKPLEILSIPDFDEEQLSEYLRQSGADFAIPDWVPTRPLLLGYLVSLGADSSDAIASTVTRAEGWRRFLSELCLREAKMFAAVRPETIQQIIARVATMARGGTSMTGPLTISQMEEIFTAVNGVKPDNEGVQLLLRLPGLVPGEGPGGAEQRSFADAELAEAAYGLDLASFVMNPYDTNHPLGGPATWVNASSGLGVQVAADALIAEQQQAGAIVGAMDRRQKSGRHDAVLADLLATLALMPSDREIYSSNYVVAGVMFEQLELTDHPAMAATTFQNCLIERLDASNVDEDIQIPYFQSCLIDFVDGLSTIPVRLAPRLVGTEIVSFSAAGQTNAGIMALSIDRESAIALSVLRKIFSQRGKARKEAALSRGLSLAERGMVPSVLAELVSQGWIRREARAGTVLYVGVKQRQRDAQRALELPNEFRLK